MCDVSFIIPIYNTPIKKLENCINSILELKNKIDFEIIAIDDGSEQFIKKFFQQNFLEDVKYIFKNNGGVSSARNFGLKVATGKFIFFVDADDQIINDTFNLFDVYEKYEFVIFDLDVIENSKHCKWNALNCIPGKISKNEVIKELVTSSKMNSPCSKLFLNKIIKQHDIRFDENMVTGEDLNFVIDYTQFVSNIYYTGMSAYCYEREESSRVTRIKNYPEKYFRNLSFMRGKLEFLIESYEMNSKFLNVLNIDHIESMYNYISDLMMLKLCTNERKESVITDIKKLKVDCSGIPMKKRLKYELLLNEKWFLINMLAYLRKLYLKVK